MSGTRSLLKLFIPYIPATHAQTNGLQQTLKDVSLTYVTPEKLYGHRGSMAGQDYSGSKVFEYLGASRSKLVSFSTDCRMKDGVITRWTGAPELNSSKEFITYRGIEQIVPLARKVGFVARCGDGFIRRYDQTVKSLSAAAQPRAKAMFFLPEKLSAGRDTFVTFISVKADGKWMVVTTSAAIYLTNWVDDDVTDEDFVFAELGFHPTVKVSDFGEYEFHAAKFDSSVEDDVTNPDMCEKHIGAFITPGEDATCTDTVMVQWRLRDVFTDNKLKTIETKKDDDKGSLHELMKVGICKLYVEHGSSQKKSKKKVDDEDEETPSPAPATPEAALSAPRVDEWTWNKGSHAIATLGDAMKTMEIHT